MTKEQPSVDRDADLEFDETGRIGAKDSATSTAPESLTDDERWVAGELKKKGIEIKFRDNRVAVARSLSTSTKRRLMRSRPIFDRGHISALKMQLEWKPVDHSHYVGYLVPDLGLAEISLDMPYQIGGWRNLTTLAKATTPNCKHARENSWMPIVEDGPLPEVDRNSEEQDSVTSQRLHLTRRDGDVCIELSNYSPLIAPSIVYAVGYPECTLKLYFQKHLSLERMEEYCEDILQAFLYELNTRNGLLFSAIRRPFDGNSREDGKKRTMPDTNDARFPVTSIQPEVARMFNFASQAAGNPTLAFLSYFQVLEYFLFTMVRRGTVKNLRNAMLDHRFNEKSDTSLVRLIEIVERSSGSVESQRLRFLINECTRKSEVTAFLKQGIWNNHFGNTGPIKGVPTLNIKDKDSGILDQVSDRVYKIRNRIVHAKDDPKYGDTRVLLPESREADSLGPDVQLVRLLAMEVILESQGRRS
ncbi:hypothetical protein AB0H88_25965 [Nonomuraea sp. NPDC050680]|uniref:hypothetical protein n=1 Tax=Nonomuraea sp. NPDC050680 TaxID=3154630 RepID=UPI0033C8ECC2